MSLLFSNTYASVLLEVPLSLAVAFWIYQSQVLNGFAIMLWLVTVNLAILVRIALYHYYVKHGVIFTTRFWEALYAMVLAFNGLAWGSFCWVSEVEMTISSSSMVVIIKTFLLLGIIVIASSTLLGSRIAFFSFLASILFPLATWLIFNQHTATPVYIIILCAALLLLLNYQMQHHSLSSAFVKRYEAHELFKQQQIIFNSVVEGIVLIRNRPERIVKCNRRFAELFGLDYEGIRSSPAWIWYGSRIGWKQLITASKDVVANGQPYQTRRLLSRKGGPDFWAEITGTAIDSENLDAGIVWVVTDINTRLAAENALRLSEQRFRDLVSLSSDVYWVIDKDGYFQQITGDSVISDHIPTEQFIGECMWNTPAITGVTDTVWREQKTLFAERRPFRDFIYQIKGTDNNIRWFSANGMPLFDVNSNFTGYHGIATNITSRVLNEEKYRHLAYHDRLTGLPNRRLLEDRLGQAIQAAKRNGYMLALLAVDLDGFKPVNDQYGHAIGDLLLEKVASLLRAGTRQMDTVSRVGGDEFTILLPELNSCNDALVVANKIHQLFSQLTIQDYPDIKVGASIGISLFPTLSKTQADLFLHADTAMYMAKNEGGHSTQVYNPLVTVPLSRSR